MTSSLEANSTEHATVRPFSAPVALLPLRPFSAPVSNNDYLIVRNIITDVTCSFRSD
jgi:hypothetical protein